VTGGRSDLLTREGRAGGSRGHEGGPRRRARLRRHEVLTVVVGKKSGRERRVHGWGSSPKDEYNDIVQRDDCLTTRWDHTRSMIDGRTCRTVSA